MQCIRSPSTDPLGPRGPPEGLELAHLQSPPFSLLLLLQSSQGMSLSGLFIYFFEQQADFMGMQPYTHPGLHALKGLVLGA